MMTPWSQSRTEKGETSSFRKGKDHNYMFLTFYEKVRYMYVRGLHKVVPTFRVFYS